MRQVTTILLGISLTLAGTLSVLSANVYALNTITTTTIADSATNEACLGIGLANGNGGSSCGDNGGQLTNVLHTIINVFSAIVGIVAVIMIIVAGLQFITSNGNPQNISKARMSLIYALIGIVIVVLAQVIVHFVFSQAMKAT